MVVDLDGLADGVGLAEEAGGQCLRYEGGGRVRGRLCTAAEDPEPKHAGKILLSPNRGRADVLLFVAQKVVAAVANQGAAREEARVLVVKGLAKRHGDYVTGDGLIFSGIAEHRFDGAAVVRSVFVETELVGDPKTDEKRDSHAGGEAGDVDKAIAFALDQVAPGEKEVVAEHVSDFWIGQGCCQKNAGLVRI